MHWTQTPEGKEKMAKAQRKAWRSRRQRAGAAKRPKAAHHDPVLAELAKIHDVIVGYGALSSSGKAYVRRHLR